MADSNDELLEDGDLSETNFDELDLAEEDALLADDDEKSYRSYSKTVEKGAQDDDDYLEMGVDEDLVFPDEVLENGNEKVEPQPTETHDNDDSDDNSSGERSRFKSERKISTTIPSGRNASAIPETLDAVAVRNPVKVNNRGNRGGGGGGGGKAGRGGAQNRKFGRNHPNIHVNPHFRPRVPIGGPHMWNGGYPGQPPQSQFQHPPPYGGGFQPPMQPPPPPQWNDQGYYNPPPGPPQYNQPPVDNHYYSQDNYYQPPNYHVQPPPPPQPQMGWGDNFYQGHPQNYQPPPFQSGPGTQMGPPRMRPPFHQGHRPPLNHQNKMHGKQQHHNQGNHWGGNARPQKREQFQTVIKPPPIKQQKFENTNAHRVRSNLQEVKIVDSLPPETVAEEEDEEMKAYRKKIEEQKKLREKILREKEEKRLVAAQQKALESAVVSVVVPSVVPPKPVIPDGPPGVTEEKYKMVRVRGADGKTVIKKLTLEEIKKLKKVPPPAKDTPLNTIGMPSRVVSVENLSASTTQKQLESIAGNVGPFEKVELDRNKKIATIRFIRVETAKDFVTKYQRKMIDLSMIGVKFIN